MKNITFDSENGIFAIPQSYHQRNAKAMKPSLHQVPPFLQRMLRQYEVNGYYFHTVLVEKGSLDAKLAHLPGNSTRQIVIDYDFELSVHPVTVGLWKSVMQSGQVEERNEANLHPVEQISWNDICREGGFLDVLNNKMQSCCIEFDGKRFRLPTAAEWEYAGHGGKFQGIASRAYAGSNHLNEVGWYHNNSGRKVHEVGQKMANILGLHDMSGNVWEWVSDSERQGIDSFSDATDSKLYAVDQDSNRRIYRGGSWFTYDRNCLLTTQRASSAEAKSESVGFRLALTVK